LVGWLLEFYSSLIILLCLEEFIFIFIFLRKKERKIRIYLCALHYGLKNQKITVPKFCFTLNLGKTKTFDFSLSRLELTLFYYSILLEISKMGLFY
jgi:hypothetical protein